MSLPPDSTKSKFSAALNEPVPPLYKFQPYSGEPYRSRVQRTLMEGAIYFARPPEFNDPFEARPSFVRSSDDPKRWRRDLVKFAQPRYSGSRQQRRAAARQFAKTADPSLQGLRDKQWEDLARETAIFSMSATREQILLWSHYAADHTGVCIHIDHTRPPFGIALPVTYSDDYPQIRIPRTESDGDTYMKLLHTKASAWSYEREYRLCRIEHAPEYSRRIGMEWDGQIAFAPIDRFTGITLGARMPEKCRRELIALATSRDPTLEVWQASIHESQYALTFDRIP